MDRPGPLLRESKMKTWKLRGCRALLQEEQKPQLLMCYWEAIKRRCPQSRDSGRKPLKCVFCFRVAQKSSKDNLGTHAFLVVEIQNRFVAFRLGAAESRPFADAVFWLLQLLTSQTSEEWRKRIVCPALLHVLLKLAGEDEYRTRALRALCRSVSPSTVIPPSVQNELRALSLNDIHAKQMAVKEDPLFSWTLCALSELFVRVGIDQGQVSVFPFASRGFLQFNDVCNSPQKTGMLCRNGSRTFQTLLACLIELALLKAMECCPTIFTWPTTFF